MQYKIIVDKQPSSNPSDEIKEYVIDIEELRIKGDIYDSLVITKGEDYVMRRLELTKYHKLNVLDTPIKQPLTDLNIELFEGDNYIYLMDMTGNKFYAEYLVKNDFTDMYVTRNEMNSSINQTASQIELSVNQKLSGFSTTEEMNSTITQTADEIKSIVSVSIGTVNLVANSDFSHQDTNGQYDLKNWVIDNNESSDPVVVIDNKTWLSMYKQTSGQASATQILKPVNKNEYYTLSFKLINESEFTQNVGMTFSLKSASGESIKGFDYWPTIEVTDEIQTFNYTFQTPDDDTINYLDFGIQTYNTSESYTSVLITDIQLEIGKIATEWRASQTDYYYKIEQYSKVVQTVDKISSEVALKAGKDEMNSKIEQTANEINLEVSKKVGNDEVISKINQSAEAVGIQANKIELTANDILNLIAGNAINLTSKNITITSNSFKVDKNGKVTCSDIDITGGKIILKDSGDKDNHDTVLEVKQGDKNAEYGSWGMYVSNSNGGDAGITPEILYVGGNGCQLNFWSADGSALFSVLNNNTGVHPINITETTAVYKAPTGNTSFHLQSNGAFVKGDGLYVNGYKVSINTSDKKLKKDIQNTNVKAVEMISKIQHRQFNWKENNTHEDIGYIAQELEEINPNYVHKDPQYDEDGNMIDYYYQVNILPLLATTTKAIQEQQEIIEKLNKRIEELEAK